MPNPTYVDINEKGYPFITLLCYDDAKIVRDTHDEKKAAAIVHILLKEKAKQTRIRHQLIIV